MKNATRTTNKRKATASAVAFLLFMRLSAYLLPLLFPINARTSPTGNKKIKSIQPHASTTCTALRFPTSQQNNVTECVLRRFDKLRHINIPFWDYLSASRTTETNSAIVVACFMCFSSCFLCEQARKRDEEKR